MPRPLPWCASLLFLLAISCASAKETSNVQAAPAGPTAEETAAKRAGLTRDLELAKAKLDNAHADMKRQESSNAEALAAAETDLAIATRALGQFDEKSSKIRLERARLDLSGSQDNLDEAKEELQQIELMYEKTELADKTKELVIRRNQRRVDRATRGLDLQKRSLESMEASELPQERARLQADVDAKTRALARTRRDADAAIAEKKVGLMALEGEARKVETALAAMPAAAAAAR